MEVPEKKIRISSFEIMIFVIGILWLILFLSLFIPIKRLGILPRDINGLKGILFAPFIHAHFFHLTANSISLFILGWIFLALEKKRAIMITILIIVLGGLGTWLIGRSGAVHIGSSGVIYGLMGYLFSAGIFNRNIKTIIVSLITFIVYGGAIWGVFPGNTFISWESHLCGLLAGIMTAKMYSKPRLKD